MTLKEAITRVTALAPKSAGQLIRNSDWNTLIESLLAISATVADNRGRLDQVIADAATLRTELDSAVTRLDVVEADLDTLRTQLSPLLENYLVRTSCERTRYAMGEVCVITAEVTTLTGEAITDRPWIDFVTSWGRLRNAPGFESRPGVGGTSASVRVNSDGIARVQLRANHTEGFTETEEQEVEGSLKTRVEASNTTIARTILDAASPKEFTARAAFKALSLEYERSDSNAMRSYVDTYFVRQPEYQIRPIRPNPFTNWRDYRATVTVMAKPDSDPTTADYSRGASSIQITFRDWIDFWIHDFVHDVDPGIRLLLPDLEPIFTKPVREATIEFEKVMKKQLERKGVVGRMRAFDEIKQAVTRVDGVTDPVMEDFRTQVQKAVAMQEAGDINQWVYSVDGAAAEETPAALAILSMQRQAADVGRVVADLSGKVRLAENLHDSIAVLEGRMQAAEGVGINIDQRLNLINDSVKAINVMDETNLRSNVNKITADIELIRARLGRG